MFVDRMTRIIRQLMFAVLAVVMVGGSNPISATSAQSMAAISSMPCDMEMPIMSAGQEMPVSRCNGTVSDCFRHWCCVTANLLPADLHHQTTAVEYSTVAYWASSSKLAGVQREPDHLPPRTT